MSVHTVAYFIQKNASYIVWRPLGLMMLGAISLFKSTGGITLKSLKTKQRHPADLVGSTCKS